MSHYLTAYRNEDDTFEVKYGVFLEEEERKRRIASFHITDNEWKRIQEVTHDRVQETIKNIMKIHGY